MKKLLLTTPAVAALAASSLFALSTPASAASDWDRLAECESNGNWSIDTGNGYYGGLQFSQQSWEAVGGTGNPAHASKAEQIQRAEQLRQIQGWGAWPACSAKLGLSGAPSGTPSAPQQQAPAQQAPAQQAPAPVQEAPVQSAPQAPVTPVEEYVAPAKPTTDVEHTGETYVIESGDTLHEIAVEFDVEGGYNTLFAWNDNIDNPELIFVGEEIIVG